MILFLASKLEFEPLMWHFNRGHRERLTLIGLEYGLALGENIYVNLFDYMWIFARFSNTY